MKHPFLQTLILIIIIGLLFGITTAANSNDELDSYLFTPGELGDGWKLVTTVTPEEPLVGITGSFKHMDNSTFYQTLLQFENNQVAHQHYDKLKTAGEEVSVVEDLADEAYIKPSIKGKPREFVFRKNNIVTIYLWSRAEGAEDPEWTLINLARLQLNKMEKENK